MSIPHMTFKNHPLLIIALCVLSCLPCVRAQDTTPLNPLSTTDDVLGYAQDVAVKVTAAHPEGGAGTHWGDAYLNGLSQVDRKTLLSAIDQVDDGSALQKQNWRQARIEYFFLGGALNKFATQTDIPMLLSADTVDSLRAISMKKMADDPQVTAFLVATLQQYQATLPADSDKTVFLVLLLSNQNHDPKVNAALADVMSKAAADPNASKNYLRMLSDCPQRVANRSANIVALVPALKARVAAAQVSQANP